MSAVFLEAAVVFVCSVTTTEQPSPAALLVCGLPSSPMRAVIDDLAFLLSADFFGVIFIYLFFAFFASEQMSGCSNVPTSAQNICEGSTSNLQRWGQTPACVRAR